MTDTLSRLLATRDALHTDLDTCTSMRDRAALYARYVDVLLKIEERSPTTTTRDLIDEIKQRRVARDKRAASGASRAEDKAKLSR